MDDTPMTVIGYYNSLIETAMKNGDKDMLSLFRLIKTELIKQQKEKGVEESAVESLPVYKSMKKKLLEEIDVLEKAGRDTSIQKKHLQWIEDQLPQPVLEEDIRSSIKEYILDFPDTNIGKIMGHLKLIYTGKMLDMGLASKIAKEIMNK